MAGACRLGFGGAVVVGTLLASAGPADAQSGSGGGQPRYGAPAPAGSGQRAPAAPGSVGSGSADKGSADKGSGSAGSGSATRPVAPVAMQGYCPVAIVDASQWVQGLPEFVSVVDGRAYQFVNLAAKARFDADPATYVPALGGDDVVVFAQTGQRVPGSLAYGARHGKRVFFFASDENKRRFMASAVDFASADLALGGECVVCRVDMQQAMPGRPDMTTFHNGLRFQFVGREQQQRFLSQPARYAPAAASVATPAGSGSQHKGSQMKPIGGGAMPGGSGDRGSNGRGSGDRGSETKGSDDRGSGAQPGSGSSSGGSLTR